jgi:tetratricopeptide (TPR) repeat protein
MTVLLRRLAVVAALGLPVLAGAQQGPPGRGPQRGQQPPAREGQPPRLDAVYFASQTLKGLQEKADLLQETGKKTEAIETLKEAWSVEIPNDSPAYEHKVHVLGNLAKAYAEMNRKSEALETLKRIQESLLPGSPSEAMAWLQAGEVYKKLAMPEEALAAFDKSIALSKKLAETGWRPPPPRRPEGPGATP